MGSPAILARLRVTRALRPGSADGSRAKVDKVLHSDTLFSALTCAFDQLGSVAGWLEDTAESVSPLVRLSSAFPFVGRTLFVPAPKNVWPPVGAGKLRWKAARFVPLSMAGAALRGDPPNEDRWVVDPVSECLLPVERNGVVTEPFRVALRSGAAVDRISGLSATTFSSACLEFNQGAGLWCVVAFANAAARTKWAKPVESAFRLLADTGLGGERSSGWGQLERPDFESVQFPDFLGFPKSSADEPGHWMMSLYTPAEEDAPDWRRGAYSMTVRSGWSSRGDKKRSGNMVEEGSVLVSEATPVGRSWNVAPEGQERALYRWGVGLSVPVPVKVVARAATSREAATTVSELEAVLAELEVVGKAEAILAESESDRGVGAEEQAPSVAHALSRVSALSPTSGDPVEQEAQPASAVEQATAEGHVVERREGELQDTSTSVAQATSDGDTPEQDTEPASAVEQANAEGHVVERPERELQDTSTLVAQATSEGDRLDHDAQPASTVDQAIAEGHVSQQPGGELQDMSTSVAQATSEGDRLDQEAQPASAGEQTIAEGHVSQQPGGELKDMSTSVAQATSEGDQLDQEAQPASAAEQAIAEDHVSEQLGGEFRVSQASVTLATSEGDTPEQDTEPASTVEQAIAEGHVSERSEGKPGDSSTSVAPAPPEGGSVAQDAHLALRGMTEDDRPNGPENPVEQAVAEGYIVERPESDPKEPTS